jgi:F-type H+-transporting ATPase subunit gamma
MVATSKLKRAQDRVEAARPYAERLGEVIARLLTPGARRALSAAAAAGDRAPPCCCSPPTAAWRAPSTPTSSVRRAPSSVPPPRGGGGRSSCTSPARRGSPSSASRRGRCAARSPIMADRPTAADDASASSTPLMERFVAGDLDAVYVVYAKFNSALSTPPPRCSSCRWPPAEGSRARRATTSWSRADEILEAHPPAYVRNMVYRALVETVAAEQGARRTAMKNATDNAGDMLESLTRTYNRVRQARSRRRSPRSSAARRRCRADRGFVTVRTGELLHGSHCPGTMATTAPRRLRRPRRSGHRSRDRRRVPRRSPARDLQRAQDRHPAPRGRGAGDARGAAAHRPQPGARRRHGVHRRRGARHGVVDTGSRDHGAGGAPGARPHPQRARRAGGRGGDIPGRRASAGRSTASAPAFVNLEPKTESSRPASRSSTCSPRT